MISAHGSLNASMFFRDVEVSVIVNIIITGDNIRLIWLMESQTDKNYLLIKAWFILRVWIVECTFGVKEQIFTMNENDWWKDSNELFL